jgi:AcrR family transcriptional regulator
MGRPRAFDTDVALDQAMLVFWRVGYDGASLDDLTEAMGINRPSLYAAFGSKEGLFRRALERYSAGPSGYEAEALALPTAREVTEALLRGGMRLQTGEHTPHGCLAVFAAHSGPDGRSSVGHALVEARVAGENALLQRFERAQAEGDLPPDADPAQLADFVRALVYGMTVKAANGATREQLDRVIDLAMNVWDAAVPAPA